MTVWHHPAYEEPADPVIASFRDPQTKASYSSPAQVVKVVCESATDGKDQLMYFAGEDAKASYALRRKIGDEAFRKQMRDDFLRSEQPTLSPQI